MYEVTGGQPEYIYSGTFMNLGERALTGNYRPTQRHVSINTGLSCIYKRLEGKGLRAMLALTVKTLCRTVKYLGKVSVWIQNFLLGLEFFLKYNFGITNWLEQKTSQTS